MNSQNNTLIILKSTVNPCILLHGIQLKKDTTHGVVTLKGTKTGFLKTGL